MRLGAVVVHIERDKTVRIISARPASRREWEAHEKAHRTTKRVQVREQMRAEYDVIGGVRGEYAERFAEGTNLVLLAPDLAAEFPTSSAVNKALRGVIKARTKRRTASRSG